MRRRACGLGLALVSLLVTAGCGKHYWSKPGAGADDFGRDSSECARENALYRSGTKDFGIVLEDRYKACLMARGWVRAQKREPPPPGWYRGIEGDETVRFNTPAPQSPPGPRSGAPGDSTQSLAAVNVSH